MYAWVFKAISGGFNDYSSLSLLTSPPVEEQINRSKVDSKKKKKKTFVPMTMYMVTQSTDLETLVYSFVDGLINGPFEQLGHISLVYNPMGHPCSCFLYVYLYYSSRERKL